MTNAMPPLSQSVIRTLIPFGRKPGQIESRSMQTAGGRMYADLAPILRHPLGRRILLKAFKNADQLAVSALSELVKRPEFQTHGKRLNPLRIMPFVLPYLIKSIHMLFWGRPEGVSDKALALIDKFTSDMESKLDLVNELPERLKIAVGELQQLKRPVLTWIPFWIAGMISDTLLKTILINKADPDDLISLERGLKGNVVTEMNLAVGDLSDVARSSNTVAKVISQKNIDAETRLANLAGLPEGNAFLKSWNNFIYIYGARGPSEIDLSQPRWSEDPASVMQMVVNAMGQSQKGAHRVHYQQLITEGERAASNLIALAHKGRWGKLRAPLTQRLILVARNLTPLREHHKFLAIRVLEILKRVLVEAGDQLQKRGRLNSSKNIWFLTLPEVIEALETDQKDLNDLVAIRRIEFEHYQSLIPPRVITSEGEVPAVHLERPEAPEGALIGSPVSAGLVEGVAKIVLDPSEEALNPGEILVAPFTDPGWTPLFVNAAGLITEVGGMMTHGSVVAREYGIPAVVGVVDATKQIKTGQKIRVHGNKGYVEFIDQ
jgi:pyruvate,water dikinase